MTYMLCRNRIADFDRWKAVLPSHAEDHCAAGLEFVQLWRTVDEPDQIFFLFKIDTVEGAQASIDDPASAKAGEEASMLEGEYHLIEDAGGY